MLRRSPFVAGLLNKNQPNDTRTGPMPAASVAGTDLASSNVLHRDVHCCPAVDCDELDLGSALLCEESSGVAKELPVAGPSHECLLAKCGVALQKFATSYLAQRLVAELRSAGNTKLLPCEESLGVSRWCEGAPRR